MKKFIQFIGGLFVLYFVFTMIRAADPNSPEAQKFMSDIHTKVANDSIKELELAMKGGDLAEICVRAGMVAAAYNQAHDEKNYLLAKKLEKKACDNHRNSYNY